MIYLVVALVNGHDYMIEQGLIDQAAGLVIFSGIINLATNFVNIPFTIKRALNWKKYRGKTS